MLHDSLHCLSGFEIVPKYMFGSEGERTIGWYEGNAELGQTVDDETALLINRKGEVENIGGVVVDGAAL